MTTENKHINWLAVQLVRNADQLSAIVGNQINTKSWIASTLRPEWSEEAIAEVQNAVDKIYKARA
jgi:hypothetical protein